MTTEMPDLLPCPFCGGKPVKGLTKKTGCQLHGEPMQYATLSCTKCEFRPHCVGGDIYNGGKAQAYAMAAEKWNTRIVSAHHAATVARLEEELRVATIKDAVDNKYIDQLRTISAELAGALEEVAGDLEAEIHGKYPPETLIYPGEKRRYVRDIEPVKKAQTALQLYRDMGE